MYGILSFAGLDQPCRMIFRSMTDFERDIHLLGISPWVTSQEMKIVDIEYIFVCSFGFISLTYIKDIVDHVFLDDIPRTAPETQSMTLTDGVEPESFMNSYFLSCFQFQHISSIFSQITP